MLHLYSGYASALQRRLAIKSMSALLHLAHVLCFAAGTSAAILFLSLTSNYDYGCRAGWVLIGIAGILAGEPLLRLAARLYQPSTLQRTPSLLGSSVMLDFIFDSGLGAKNLRTDFEKLIGINLREIWIFRYLVESVESIVLAAMMLAWISTCINSVPLGSRGVLVSFGKYGAQPLQPGLHLTLPWPFQEVVPIETERVREVSLGFDKDTMAPLLWTEQHVEGEKNLLVDDGEGLLTINVPIQYRISDPIAYLKTTQDAEFALRTLAERQLLRIATIRESFHFMTDDRQAIAEALRSGIQAEADRHNLGLQVTFIGLKDIHPPVVVAPAYEKVISSEEEKEAMIDDAIAYQAHNLPLAHSQAYALTAAAQSAYTSRVDKAAGETSKFDAILAPERINPGVFRVRLRYDMLDQTLARPTKTIVGIPAGASSEFYLDLRPGQAASGAHFP